MNVRLRIGVDIAWLVVLLAAIWVANGFRTGARWFPMYIAIVAAVIAVINLIRDVQLTRRGASPPGESIDNEELRKAAYWLAWLVVYCGAVLVVGFLVATIMWLVAFLKYHAKTSWVYIAINVVGVIGVLYVLRETLGMRWPSGLLL